MAEMKPPSSHRSTHQSDVADFFSVSPWCTQPKCDQPRTENAHLLVSFLVLTKAAHCSSGFTPLQKKIKCEDVLRIGRSKDISTQKQTLDPSENPLQMMVWKIHACNCGGQRRPRIEPSSWKFFQLGNRGWELPGIPWVEPPFPTPKKWAAMKILGRDFLSQICKNSGGDEHILGRVWSPKV